MRVIDGLHRVEAARMRGATTINVRFYDGDEADAFVLAVKSNIAHGLPLSLADRKRAAARIIASHQQWSDRMVASVTGIAPGTVADIRRRTVPGTPAGSVRIGQDGRLRPVNGAEGRRLASELIAQNPGLSLRQVARAAGISPETVRDVRNRLQRGEDPLPRGRRGAPNGSGRRAAPDGGVRSPVRPVPPDRVAVVERLKADPALRFNASGRSLLMLLNLHAMKAGDWEKIVDSVPPHCSGIVAQLAKDCAELWAEFAVRLERQVTQLV